MLFLVNLLKKNIFSRYFFLFFLFYFTHLSDVSSQEFVCGTDEPTQQEYMNQLRSKSQINSSSRQTNYSIPIHIIVVRDDNGNNPSGYNLASIDNVINSVNSHFTNGMSFYRCEETFKNSSQYYNINKTANESPYPLFHVSDAINLYVVNSIIGAGGFAFFPNSVSSSNQIVLYPNNISSLILAHELGHYFDLFHTFSPVSGINCTGTPVGLTENCNTSGDFICDTPPDPGTCNCSNSGCQDVCNNGAYTNYTPDKSNIMSYYSSCVNEFSPQQLTRMKDELTTGLRKFLVFVDGNCNTVLPEKGNVERVNQNNSLPNFDPFPSLNVEKRDMIQNKTIWSSTNSSGDYSTISTTFGYDGSDVYLEPDDYPAFQEVLFPLNGITAFDLTRIRQHIYGQVPLQSYGLIAADASNDGTVSAFDMLKIQQVILGINEEFPAGSWRYLPKMALGASYNFELNFNSNPFTAIWNSPTGARSYLSSPSYLDQVEFNLSNNLASEEDTWSFNAIKVGDVNFSATLPGGGNLMTATSRNSKVNLIFIESEDCIKRGEEFTLEFELEPNDIITGYQFGFDFDFKAMEFVKVKKGNFSKFDIENFGLTKMDKNEFRTLWVDEEAKNNRFTLNNRKVFSLQLKASTEVCSLKEFITLNDEVLDNFLYDSNFEYIGGDLIVNIKKVKEANIESGNQLGSIFPNPVKNTLNINFTLDAQQSVSIQIIDTNGGEVFFEERFQSGKHIQKLDIAGLKEGVLSCRISLGDNIYATKVIKH